MLIIAKIVILVYLLYSSEILEPSANLNGEAETQVLLLKASWKSMIRQ